MQATEKFFFSLASYIFSKVVKLFKLKSTFAVKHEMGCSAGHDASFDVQMK